VTDRPTDLPAAPAPSEGTPPDHRGDSLLDLLLGASEEAAPAAAERMRADPALAREAEGLEAFLRVEAAAFDPAPDPGAAARVAARVRERVEREETAGARRHRPVAPATRWMRWLAASIAAHALLLGFVAWRMDRGQDRAGEPDAGLEVRFHAPAGTREPGDDLVPAEPIPEAQVLVEEPLPVEVVLRGEPVPETPPPLEPPSGRLTEVGSFPPSAAHAMRVRVDPRLKERVLLRAGFDAKGTLAQVARGLNSLARLQADDGSFAPAAGRSRVYATALTAMAYLGDGHSSRGGEHRATVARTVGWLRAHAGEATTPGEVGVLVCALVEDGMLSHGERTPAEALAARAERASLAAALERATAAKGSEAGAPLPDVVWSRLGRRALARAGAGFATGADDGEAWSGVLPAVAAVADSDPSAALFEGTALLLAERSPAAREEFRRWSEGAGKALLRLLGPTGLVDDPSRTPEERAEATALALLGLELVFRTY
jgi:hypothetical protein